MPKPPVQRDALHTPRFGTGGQNRPPRAVEPLAADERIDPDTEHILEKVFKTGMMENTFLSVKNRSKTITAEIEVPESGANGTLIAQGERFGGWSLYVKDGAPCYDYNFLGLQRGSIVSNKKLSPGKATVRFDFAYAGGGPGKGGKGKLYVNDEKVAEGKIAHTQAAIFSADETADVGIDLDTPVVETIGSKHKSRFTGKIPKLTVEVKH